MRALLLILATTAVAHAEMEVDVAFTEVSGSQDRLDSLDAIVRAQTTFYRSCFADANRAMRVHVHLVVTAAGKVTGAGVAAPSGANVPDQVVACVRSVAKATPFTALTEKTHIDFVVSELPEPMTGGAFASLTGTGDISSGFDDENIYGGLLGNDAGVGNGSGGVGWGTIGTGKVGTIGKGTGTGKGYGMGKGRRNAPTTSIGQANVKGDLDKAIIRRYVKRNSQKILFCYEKELDKHPKLAGNVMASFHIDANGLVTHSTASGVDPAVSSCVADVIKTIEFPKPQGGGSVDVNYPFTFNQAE